MDKIWFSIPEESAREYYSRSWLCFSHFWIHFAHLKSLEKKDIFKELRVRFVLLLIGSSQTGCFKPGCLQFLRGSALLRSFADLRLRSLADLHLCSFVVICVLLRACACFCVRIRTTAFGNCRIIAERKTEQFQMFVRKHCVHWLEDPIFTELLYVCVCVSHSTQGASMKQKHISPHIKIHGNISRHRI